MAAKFEYDLLYSKRPEDTILNQLLSRKYAERESKSAVKQKLDSIARKYFSDFIILFKNLNLTPGGGWMLGMWDTNYGSTVIYNSKSLITIKYSELLAEGSNHGARFDYYYSYSLADRRQIQMSDFIDPKYRELLETLLIKNMHSKGCFKDLESVTLPDDFYVTSRGVTLLYPMSTLGGRGYAYFDYFISFSELGDKIKRQSWMEF